MRKIFAMLLALVLCACMLVSCNKEKGEEKPSGSAVTESTVAPTDEKKESHTEAPQPPKQDWTNFY